MAERLCRQQCINRTNRLTLRFKQGAHPTIHQRIFGIEWDD